MQCLLDTYQRVKAILTGDSGILPANGTALRDLDLALSQLTHLANADDQTSSAGRYESALPSLLFYILLIALSIRYPLIVRELQNVFSFTVQDKAQSKEGKDCDVTFMTQV